MHEKVLKAVPFVNWLNGMKKTKLNLNEVFVQSVDMFGPKVGFIKFKTVVTDVDGDSRPVVVFMRGGSVAILVVLVCKGKEYGVLVRQDSVPTTQPLFPAIPAGMLDGNGNFGGVAAKELEEETGIKIHASELVDLIELAYPDGKYEGMYVSVGGTDEFIRLYYVRKEVSEEVLKDLEGKETGLAAENEKIVLKVMPLENLWSYTSDSKTLSALCLYQNLKKMAKII
uniref:Nudix hydrolase domain-containing protein n=1 Tax=Arcella intermedia TaxID=1963864 RepID=A0A6B2LGL6_9EUKA